MGGRSVEIQLDVFNVLNLVNAAWGRCRVAVPALLEHVGQTTAAGTASQPIFRFADDAGGWTTVPGESEFQLQLAARYRF